MELNNLDFQTEEKDRLAAELYKLRSRRQFCLFEMENEQYFQSKIAERIERAKIQLRLYFFILIPLTFFCCYKFLRVVFYVAGGSNSQFAFVKFPLGILAFILLIPCAIGWVKMTKLALSLTPGGSKNVFEEDLRKTLAKQEALKKEKKSLDEEIQILEIDISKAKQQSRALNEPKFAQEQLSDQQSNKSFSNRGFSLRNDNDESDEIHNERINEVQKTIEKLKKNIEIENNKIAQCEQYVRDLNIEYKKVKLILAQFIIGLVLIFILQAIPGAKTDLILAVIAYLTVIVLLVMYETKFKKIIDAYLFEQNPSYYKEIGARYDWVCSTVKIKAHKKEIIFYEQDIQLYEEKLHDLQN